MAPPPAPSVAAAPGVRTRLQSAGRFLSGMVMPNIGAFIVWGFITACFIPTGWFPHAGFARLVGPMITYLLPLLIGYTGGQMIHGGRGGVVGAVATMGAIVSSDLPMFLGAMTVGPATAWLLKHLDAWAGRRTPAGFEMLVNNFSLGLLGGGCALLAYLSVGPALAATGAALARVVRVVVDHDLLPLAHLLIEPGKVLFLNNAINHGILGPLAISESHAAGKSLLFMLESNPGPGCGLLLALWWQGRGAVRQSAPSAALVHFLGGIHEIYFPYILMAPRLLLATIAGGMGGTFTFSLLGAGLVAVPSPGSIFAYVALAPRDSLGPVLAGVAIATAISFSVAVLLLRFAEQPAGTAAALAAASDRTAALKGGPARALPATAATSTRPPRRIVFACDAGMGSSAMGASLLRRKFQAAGIAITVTHSAIDELPADADLVLSHQDLTARARLKLPTAEHCSVQNLLQTPVYDQLVARFAPRP
jgi:PTS system mannitol-specific IIC component